MKHWNYKYFQSILILAFWWLSILIFRLSAQICIQPAASTFLSNLFIIYCQLPYCFSTIITGVRLNHQVVLIFISLIVENDVTFWCISNFYFFSPENSLYTSISIRLLPCLLVFQVLCIIWILTKYLPYYPGIPQLKNSQRK